MPELPDVVVYIEALTPRVIGQPLERLRLLSPFVLRSVEPAPTELEGRPVRELRRLGKRIVWGFDDGLFLVMHLMIAGRLRWHDAARKPNRRLTLATLHFPAGVIHLTEASKKKRASLHVVRGEEALAAHDRGGLEVLDADRAAFAEVLRRENHTLKRTLTDPHLFSGIGNAYSDEILHRARLSPVTWSTRLDEAEIDRLHAATVEVLEEWTQRLREQVGDGFPDKVTAFRPEMAVHGRYRQPGPVCGSPVQRILYADKETNYCANCQTGGKLLADRALSRLMKKDWPKTLEELEELRGG